MIFFEKLKNWCRYLFIYFSYLTYNVEEILASEFYERFLKRILKRKNTNEYSK